MKKITVGVLVASASMFIGCTKPAGVNFNLSGYSPEDSVIVYVNNIGGSDKDVLIDTLAAPNGVLFMPAEHDKAKSVVVFKYPKLDLGNSVNSFHMKPIYSVLMPGANMTVSGTTEDFVITGNRAFYEDCNKVEGILKPYKARVNVLLAEIGELDPYFDKEERDSLFKEMMSIKQPVDSIIFDYVSKNPDSDAALYMLYKNTRGADAVKHIDGFSQEVREGALSDLYNMLKERGERARKRAQEKKENGLGEGSMAPDFTLKNDKGKSVSLSSLRGKYIVLDFWGTWCGWCIKGIPAMKEMYNKYSDKLEIVGIACGDTEKDWKECIKKNGMNWTNLINGENDNLPKLYSVKGYPTKVIISPDGRVLKTVIGESQEFYTYIDSLMKE